MQRNYSALRISCYSVGFNVNFTASSATTPDQQNILRSAEEQEHKEQEHGLHL